MNKCLACVLAFLVYLSSCGYGPVVTAQTVIFNSSSSAKPGEAISLQGSFSATAKIYLSQGTQNTTSAMPVLVQSLGQATVSIPANWSLDLYQAWVVDGTTRSPSVFINRARGMHYNSPDVVPGGSVRIFGRNLKLAGATPHVRFVQQETGTSTDATVASTGSDAYKLVVSVPTTLLPGKIYDVYVTNGFGATLGETKVELSLNVIPAAANYFNLPVDWGHKFDYYTNVYNVKTDPRLAIKALGNGAVDDKNAIQQCINKAAQAGGGIVYLPAGTYKLLASGWGGLEMASRVMMVGAGKDQTIIRYGYAGTPTGFGVTIHSKTSTFGIADLTIENISDDAKWEINLGGEQFSEFVMQRVRYKLNRGRWLDLADSDKICITDCEITQGLTNTTGYRGPVRLDGSKNIVFAGNTVTFAVDGLNFNFTTKGGANNIVFENNLIQRDGSYRWPVADNVCNHMVSFNFTYNVANLNNTYKIINGNEQRSNDGETIIAEQGAAYTPDESASIVSSATASTLTDNTKSWGSLVQLNVGVGVAIVYGKGMGQWRQITNRTATTLALRNTWDVIPDATSRYCIFPWGASNWLVQGNTMQGNQRGITIYQNATRDVAIADNILINSGSIDLYASQKETTDLNTTVGIYPIYNVQVVNNSVSDLDGKNGVFIGVHTVQHGQTKTFGTSVIGVEVRNNTVTAHTPNKIALVDANYPNGYLNYLEFHSMGKNYRDEQVPAILGSIFQNNTAANCNYAVHLNTGSYNTLVCDMKLVNATKTVKDSTLDGTNHASIRSATCAASTTSQLPVADPKVNAPIPRNSGPASLLPLSGSSPIGTITEFAIRSLPLTTQGALYFKGKLTEVNTTVPATEAGMLSFKPNSSGNYTGNAEFSYVATDNRGMVSTAATFVVPIAIPLLVELTQFQVTAKNYDALLTWATASEKDNDHFDIERSLDGTTFTTIGRMHGQGDAVTNTVYSFTDVGIGANNQSLVYYRLKQVDLNSSSNYSPMRTVAFSALQLPVVSIYPNPTDHQLHVSLPISGAYLTIYSATGSLVLKATTDTTAAILDVKQLPAGVYSLLIQSTECGVTQHKFVKN